MGDPETLAGGNFNQVTKEGGTVVRQCGPWSPFVHQLLQFLAAKGFTESPVLLETGNGFERLTFIEGQVGNYPLNQAMRSDASLLESAQLLRRFHDLTQEFEVSAGTYFLNDDLGPEPREVICHNDFAPYNCVYDGSHIVGVIDFDTAAPGNRLWDIAYAVYRFVPLVVDSHSLAMGWETPPNREARLLQFCDAYGLQDRSRLIETVIERLESLVKFMQRNDLNASHIPLYLDDIAFLRANQSTYTNLLTGR